MATAEVWVRRMIGLNVLQVGLNIALAGAVGVWLLSTEALDSVPERAGPNAAGRQDSAPQWNNPPPGLDPSQATGASALVGGSDPAPAPPGTLGPDGLPVAPPPGQDGPPPRLGELGDGVAPGAAATADAAQATEPAQPAPAAPPAQSPGDPAGGMPPTAVAAYLEEAVAALEAAGQRAGVNVSQWTPTSAEQLAAARTGDFFNPKTLTVLRKMRRGFIAAGATMPPIPEEAPAGTFD